MEWREEAGVRWLEAALPGARAVFSTRRGGVSAPPFESLNLGLLTGDEPGSVRENRLLLADAVGIHPHGVLIGRQVHGAELSVHSEAQEADAFARPGPRLAEVDGHATARPGLVPLVFVADCLPIALAGPRGVAMVHGGWRGLAGGIVERGAEAVSATAAAVGPGIGPCCYEVGEEVLDAFSGLGAGIAEGRRLDLAEAARRLLAAAGVGAVESSGICVSCERELFFSHRRDAGTTGRQAGMVELWPS
ncbi:MAG: polyphenol oxidase family protein [Solirubrobacterales bacterium]